MTDHVADKSVVITGAGSGFGRLIAVELAALGARAVCVDIDADSARETAAEIGAAGGTALAIAANVVDPDALTAAVAEAIDTYGWVDVLVNNAGTMPLALFADHDRALAEWHRAIDINVKGTVNGIAAVYDHMIERGKGHIVNISSIYGNHPTLGAGVYGATKAAINFLSESLRVEASGKIKVSTVRPTGVPGTGLSETIVNRGGVQGILGHNYDEYLALRQARTDGTLDASMADPENMRYLMLAPEQIARAVVYVIDQPDGVSIGDITVRASGEQFVI